MTEQRADQPADRFADLSYRFLAYLVDVTPLVALFVVMTLLVGESDASFTTDGNGSSSSRVVFGLTGVAGIVYFALVLVWFVHNWVVRHGRTGQTVGKKTMDITVLDATTRQPIGGGMTFVRQLAHVLDALPCFIGYLVPLWDAEKRTFADMVIGTRVYKV